MTSIDALKIKIKKLKLELVQLAKEANDINDQQVIDKSHELDELIILYMEKKNLVG